VGEPALEACGDYGDLANWPVSPQTNYYNLAGRDFSGTCRRAAELADEKAKQGVGQRFLEEMRMANHAPTKSSRPAPSPQKGKAEEQEARRRWEEEEDHRRRSEEREKKAERDRNYSEKSIDATPDNEETDVQQDYVERTDRKQRRLRKKKVAKDGGTRGSVEGLVAAGLSGLAMQYGLPPEVVNDINVANISLIIGAVTLAGRVLEAVIADGKADDKEQ
jgi:hypothetical protein